MFEDLFDAIQLKLFSWSWPLANATVSEVLIERIGDPDEKRLRLSECYKFYVNDDGPYTGESFWEPSFSFGLVNRMRDARKTMKQKHNVPVRFRPGDPSQSRLDREAWRGL